MQAVVGVVPRDSDAQHIVNALRRIGIPNRHVSVLSPGMRERAIRAVPTTDAEAPGIGGAIGGVVGGAAGTAGGLAVASLVLPGVGPVVAAGAIALGLVGALAGGRLDHGSTTRFRRGFRRTSSTSTGTRFARAGASSS